MFPIKGKRIFVAGHRGMVGSALVRRLSQEDCEIIVAGREQLDLRRQDDVEAFLQTMRPDAVVVAAAKVGGILANQHHPVEFLRDNLTLQGNLISGAHLANVERLLFLGSSCVYPKFAPQPISEEALLTGPLEPTNEPYAIAKIAGIKLADAYRSEYGRNYNSAMPTNLYGPGDNFDLATSHVLPALIRKAHEARRSGVSTMTIWGTGTPRREFLHVDDCADALVLLLKTYDGPGHVNVGSGGDISILELTELVCRIIGFEGELIHDLSKPDGTPRKLMSDRTLRAYGWQPSIALEDGIRRTYAWFLANLS